MLRSQSDPGMNVTQLNNVAVNVVEGVCSIISMPVEIIIRPWHGTRYFPVPIRFFSTMLMVGLPLMSAVTTDVLRMLPMQYQPPAGLFSLWSLSKLYFLLSFLHGIRLWRRMLHMETEIHSEYEGEPLPFFQLFPKSDSFWFTRIVLEPAFMLVTATVLGRMYIFQYGLIAYLQVAALALAGKQAIAWFRAWEYLRELMDAKSVAPIIARMIDNRATEKDLATIHLASFPKNVAPDIRQAAVEHIARVFTQEPTEESMR